ncbi:MAG TPA: YlbF family regulator [Oscillospiraceae bacterium]|nr:YlbF family regulator [Oscillospiraceae bacterium]HPF54907.1 YlbF family regulator [Clostridiales bacterium]HPK34966.1 YlbF family regulator [Oscillospiraceae bacterium]HPR75524.1 YlbF family regulator [Oscillospiraceae bacterium]
MDKVIAKTLELAHTMMEDDRFLAYRLAAQANDEDEALQKLIGDFNLARMNLNNAANGGKDTDQIQGEMKLLYGQIMANETMQKYSTAQTEMNAMIQQVNAIISGTIDGQIPEEIDINASCGGDCDSCGGSCSH